MKQNNEIRFPTTTELKILIDNLHKEKFSEIIKTRFYEKVFLLGINDLQRQLLNQLPSDILIKLLKLKK